MQETNNVNRSFSNAVPQAAILQFPGFFFMIFYWIFTTNPNYYTSECDLLLDWSEVILYFSGIGFSLSAASVPALYLSLFNIKSEKLFDCLVLFYLIFTIIYMVCGLVIFTGICYAYSLNEPCGDLRSLNVVYIITYACIISLCLIWGFIVAYCTHIHRRIQNKKKKNQSQENNLKYEEF